MSCDGFGEIPTLRTVSIPHRRFVLPFPALSAFLPFPTMPTGDEWLKDKLQDTALCHASVTRIPSLKPFFFSMLGYCKHGGNVMPFWINGQVDMN